MAIKSIREINIKGKRVFFRFDFNVPLDSTGIIKDDTRIRRALPTINYAIAQGAKSVLTSHLGRPKGERKPEMSLRPVALRLSELLGREVGFVDDCIGSQVKEAVAAIPDGGLVMLENLRFHPGETKNDPEFARALASISDVYVNDAFGTAHRAHASTVGIAELVKEKAAGLLLTEELENLAKAFSNPSRPVVAVFGGAKVSDKLSVLTNIFDRMDVMLIGGGMANTFLKAKGDPIGASKVEEDMLGTACEMLASGKTGRCEVRLPVDVLVAENMDEGSQVKIVDIKSVPTEAMALDIGPQTIELFKQEIKKAKTIIWNGPMGVFEIVEFSRGTMEIAKAVAESAAFSVVGGGDTIRAVQQAGVAEGISYISTGGGAFMEFMEGKTLPGVAALES